MNHIVYIIDAGNTLVKFAKFEKGCLKNIKKVNFNKINEFIVDQNINKFPCFASSVLDERDNLILQEQIPSLKFLKNSSKLPIEINYKTPETLGLDRICNSVASFNLSKQNNALAIDIGTCVKFDFISKEGKYLGGSISPGIDLRYKSMNDYTKKLPLITEKTKTTLIGESTIESITSGVMNGIQAEINQFIERYCNEFDNLFVFMTGGDLEYFDIPIKNNTFVDEFLTIKGLYHIYLLNEA